MHYVTKTFTETYIDDKSKTTSIKLRKRTWRRYVYWKRQYNTCTIEYLTKRDLILTSLVVVIITMILWKRNN